MAVPTNTFTMAISKITSRTSCACGEQNGTFDCINFTGGSVQTWHTALSSLWLPIPFQPLRCPAAAPQLYIQRSWCHLMDPPWEHCVPVSKTEANMSIKQGIQPSLHRSDTTHLQQIDYSLCKSHHVHGHSHCIGKGKNETDGPAELWSQTARYQVVRSSWEKTNRRRHAQHWLIGHHLMFW